MAGLIAYPKVLAALTELGFDDFMWWCGFSISKSPQGLSLFWHQDSLFWNDPVSYTTQAQQWFLMYYLVDTTPQNGCLRVIPGFHLNRHPLRDRLWRHTEQTMHKKPRQVTPPSKLRWVKFVPVKAGDLVIGDARVFYAVHSNRADKQLE